MMCVTGFRAGEHLAAWADRNAEFGAEITRELEQRGAPLRNSVGQVVVAQRVMR